MKKTEDEENGKISHALWIGRINKVKWQSYQSQPIDSMQCPSNINKICHRPQKNGTQLHMEKRKNKQTQKPRIPKTIL